MIHCKTVLVVGIAFFFFFCGKRIRNDVLYVPKEGEVLSISFLCLGMVVGDVRTIDIECLELEITA